MATKASSSLNILDLATPLSCVDEAKLLSQIAESGYCYHYSLDNDSRDKSDKR